MKKNKTGFISLTGLFFLTFSMLSLEILFTRVYSYIYNHSYVYFIISLTISGIGLGSYLYYTLEERLKNIFYISIFIPVISTILLFLSSYYFSNILLSLLFTSIIFINLGIIITHVYKSHELNKFTIYFIDLIGAAIGSILTYFIIQAIGVLKTLQAMFVLLLAGAYLVYLSFNPKHIYKIVSVIRIVVISGLMFININFLIKIPEGSGKEISYFADKKDALIESSWKALGRVDLVQEYLDKSESQAR